MSRTTARAKRAHRRKTAARNRAAGIRNEPSGGSQRVAEFVLAWLVGFVAAAGWVALRRPIASIDASATGGPTTVAAILIALAVGVRFPHSLAGLLKKRAAGRPSRGPTEVHRNTLWLILAGCSVSIGLMALVVHAALPAVRPAQDWVLTRFLWPETLRPLVVVLLVVPLALPLIAPVGALLTCLDQDRRLTGRSVSPPFAPVALGVASALAMGPANSGGHAATVPVLLIAALVAFAAAALVSRRTRTLGPSAATPGRGKETVVPDRSDRSSAAENSRQRHALDKIGSILSVSTLIALGLLAEHRWATTGPRGAGQAAVLATSRLMLAVGPLAFAFAAAWIQKPAPPAKKSRAIPPTVPSGARVEKAWLPSLAGGVIVSAVFLLRLPANAAGIVGWLPVVGLGAAAFAVSLLFQRQYRMLPVDLAARPGPRIRILFEHLVAAAAMAVLVCLIADAAMLLTLVGVALGIGLLVYPVFQAAMVGFGAIDSSKSRRLVQFPG